MSQTLILTPISMHLPCDKIRISSYYGYRTHPITGKCAWHAGIDIASSGNLYAPFAGKVAQIYNTSARGNVIVIESLRRINGTYVRFLAQHLADKSIRPRVGDKVKRGAQIAVLGNTGASTGIHLHYEIHLSKDRKEWTVVDPLLAITAQPSQPIQHVLTIEDDEARDGYVLEVKRLQEILRKLYKCSNLKRDGLFGANTEKYVKRFQEDHGLEADGMVGPATRAVLECYQ